MPKVIGKVTHYYGKPHAAVIDLKEPLDAGETVTFDRRNLHFTQKVSSIQIDHEPVQHADSGTAIGLEVKEPVKPGTRIYRGSVS